MAIVGQNALLNQYVPSFFVKNIVNGQVLQYDSTRKAFINVSVPGLTPDTSKITVSTDNPLPEKFHAQFIINGEYNDPVEYVFPALDLTSGVVDCNETNIDNIYAAFESFGVGNVLLEFGPDENARTLIITLTGELAGAQLVSDVVPFLANADTHEPLDGYETLDIYSYGVPGINGIEGEIYIQVDGEGTPPNLFVAGADGYTSWTQFATTQDLDALEEMVDSSIQELSDQIANIPVSPPTSFQSSLHWVLDYNFNSLGPNARWDNPIMVSSTGRYGIFYDGSQNLFRNWYQFDSETVSVSWELMENGVPFDPTNTDINVEFTPTRVGAINGYPVIEGYLRGELKEGFVTNNHVVTLNVIIVKRLVET